MRKPKLLFSLVLPEKKKRRRRKKKKKAQRKIEKVEIPEEG